MSDLDAFMAQVQQNIKLLSASDPKTRRKAAAWLGEAGEPSAITRLKQVYEEDSDAGVRQAAAYSLGMFRALEEGMSGPNSEAVYDRLEDIALRGRMGRRVPVPRGCLSRLLVALLVSLAIILAFNFVIWPQYSHQISDILSVVAPAADTDETTPQSESAAPAEALSAMLAALRADAAALQTQYAAPDTLDCQAAFTNPIAFDVSAVANQPALTDLAARLNAQLVQLATARSPFLQACTAGNTSLTAEEAAVPLATLETILAELTVIEGELEAEQN